MEAPQSTNSSINSTSPKSTSSVGIMAFAIIAVLAVVLIGYKSMNKPKQVSPAEVKPGSAMTNSPAVSQTALKIRPADAKYKDGVYDVVGEYVSPGGPESIQVKLTLKDNIVTDASVISNATREKSKMFQGIFVSNYKPLVIGKSITDLKLDKVAGSSLTPKGFDDALEKIRDAAQT